MRFMILTTVLSVTFVDSQRFRYGLSSPFEYTRSHRRSFAPQTSFSGRQNDFIYRSQSNNIDSFSTPDIKPFLLRSSSFSNPPLEQFDRPRRAFASFPSDLNSFRRARSYDGFGGGAASNFLTPGGFSGGYGGTSCKGNQVLHFDGSCVEPIVTQNVFVYEAPYEEEEVPAPYVPQPELRRNIIFIKTPETIGGPDPIVIPPNQEQTIVYVLTEKKEPEQQVVHIQEPSPLKPEVFYVNYNEGENPVLPNGIDLRTALSSANANLGQAHGSGYSPISGGGSIATGGSSKYPRSPPSGPVKQKSPKFNSL